MQQWICSIHFILLTSCWRDRIYYQLMWKIPVSNRLMDLQNYPRSRKPSGIQQPEALDSKTCSTFPVRGQVAPLCACLMSRCFLFNILIFFFCVSKGLIERPAQHIVTVASGPLAEILALVLPDSELPAFWTLHLVDINWTQPAVGDKRGLSWDANPDPGGGCHGRRRGRSGTGAVDPTSRARYTGRNMNIGSMYTNISIVAYLVFGVCTLAVQSLWECMQIVCRRSRVQNLFASFLNPDQNRYVRTGMNWYVPVCTSMYQYVRVHAGMYWYELVCTGIYL